MESHITSMFAKTARVERSQVKVIRLSPGTENKVSTTFAITVGQEPDEGRMTSNEYENLIREELSKKHGIAVGSIQVALSNVSVSGDDGLISPGDRITVSVSSEHPLNKASVASVTSIFGESDKQEGELD